MSNEYIYALCEIDGEPFYVGRTGNMKRRLRDHRYASKAAPEAKYQHIRKLVNCGRGWEMVLLEEVGPNTERYENYWVYTLLMEGYVLQNQRAGDAKRAADWDAMQVLRGKNQRYSNAREFLDAVDQEVKEEQARKQAARARERIIKQPTGEDVDRTLVAGADWKEQFMSPAARAFKERRNNGKTNK